MSGTVISTEYLIILYSPSSSLLHAKRVILFNSLKSINNPLNLSSILNTNSENVVNLIINFILEAGFII